VSSLIQQSIDSAGTLILTFDIGAPSVVRDLQASSSNTTTVAIVSWNPPSNLNGDIVSYSVSIINLRDGSTVRQEQVNQQRYIESNLGMDMTAQSMHA
jgi:hypothetical protein